MKALVIAIASMIFSGLAQSQTIVSDSWWNADMAIQAAGMSLCSASNSADPKSLAAFDKCNSEYARQNIRNKIFELEDRLSAKVFANPKCSGIVMVRLNNPRLKEIYAKKGYWTLFLDNVSPEIHSASNRQQIGWQIIYNFVDGTLPGDTVVSYKGLDEPNTMISNVCGIVKHMSTLIKH